MAEQYKIRAKNSNTGNIFYVTIIGTFNPETDIKDPNAPNDPVDQDSICIIQTTVIPEEFTLKDNYGIQAVAPYPSGLSAFDSVTHDFCNQTTWWQHAVSATGETLTTSDNLTFSFAHPNIIAYRNIVDIRTFPAGDELKIYINGIATNIYDNSNITVDYRAGTATFINSQAGNTITADYAYVNPSDINRSKWTLTADTGTVVAITGARVKFSKNVNLTDIMVFDILAGGNVVARRSYYDMRTFISFSTRWEVLPAVGGYANDIIHLLYDYQGSIILDSTYGMSAQIYCQNNAEQTGEIALCTFQCVKLKG